MLLPNAATARPKLAALREEAARLKPGPVPYAESLIDAQLDLLDGYHRHHEHLHAADLPAEQALPASLLGLPPSEIEGLHVELHHSACQQAIPELRKSTAKWDEERVLGLSPADRRQRYAWSFGRDPFFVDTDGVVDGPHDSHKFVGLSQVASLPALQDGLFTLLGEGPHQGPAADAYTQAGIQYAKRRSSRAALFVNVAKGQLDFGQELFRQARRAHFVASYMQLPWPDGARIEPSHVVDQAEQVLCILNKLPSPKSLIINCYGGLDRSGITLAMTQLMLAAQAGSYRASSEAASARLMRADLTTLVANLKQARPRAITTPARALLLFEAAELYRTRQLQRASRE